MVRSSKTGAKADSSVELQRKIEREIYALREALRRTREEMRQHQARLQVFTRRLKPTLSRINMTVNQSKDLGARFLASELAVSRTFLQIALHTSDFEKRKRNLENARIAYLTLTRYRRQTLLTNKAAKVFDRKVAQLRVMFKSLGEPV